MNSETRENALPLLCALLVSEHRLKPEAAARQAIEYAKALEIALDGEEADDDVEALGDKPDTQSDPFPVDKKKKPATE